MTNLTEVHITAGDPDSGTGTVSTNDAVIVAIQAAAVTTGTQASPSTAYLSSVIAGDIAHDGVDSGNPVLRGARAIAHGTNPTAVAAADRTVLYANRAGVPFVIAGHPNVITRENTILSSDGAQTNAALVSVSAGSKIVVTQISVVSDAATSVSTAVRIGFGTATVPAATLAGTAKLILNGNFAAGGGMQKGNGAGIIGVGADDEDLRITCGAPTSGALYVAYSYYTIES